MSKNFDVFIGGDGVVGRTLALQLAQARLRVALVSRPPRSPAVADVRAYALNVASRQQLLALRAWPDPEFATPVQTMQVWGDDGGHMTFDATDLKADSGAEALAWIVDVQALEARLADAIRFQPQIEYIDEERLASHPVKAPLQVICEGQYSNTRAGLPSRHTVKPYAQRAVAARLASSQAHGGAARQWFFNGEVLALLPLSGPTGHEVALVWSVATDRAAELEKMLPDVFCKILQTACGGAVGTLQLTSERATWPLSLSTASNWVGPGWALAGDAAHTIHPMAGQGLNLGLADAACLAGVLAGREYWRSLGDERLLRRYERARKADVAAMGTVTDSLHALFAPQHSALDAPLQALRNWGMKGFALSGPFKHWVTRRAAGL
jgi:ubiquinone biosynthesis UbiH/UbiF/VisC/COQ6 family hydroxylase